MRRTEKASDNDVAQEFPSPQGTVFVVDDDQAMRESLEFLLPSIGLEVEAFESAEDFLKAYDPSRPGCLLTDVRMPGMGGLDLHEELVRRGSEISVVVMTAFADVSTAVRSMKSGAVDFIEKPFDDQELFACLRRALEKDRERRARTPPPSVTAHKQASDGTAYPPQQVAHYRILKQLGKGGMSEVFLAEDTELNRRVALKFLRLDGTSGIGDRTRFRREAQAIAALSHPNIVTIYQILEQGASLCIAMEYVEGRTLRELIDGRELGVNEAIEIAVALCAGLREAHQLGIVHRDVKPENVIVDGRGRARLLDFGIARHERSPRLTGAGHMIGTPAYMAPEQALGEEAELRSDLFALGVVLYEMLTGEPPFPGSTPILILKATLTDPPRPFPQERHDIPPQLRDLVLRALEKEPAHRFPDADSMRTALLVVRQFDTPATASTPRPSITTIAADFRTVWAGRRRGILVPMIVALVISLMAAGGLLWWSEKPSSEPPPITSTTDNTSVAVLPFTVRGVDDLAYLDHGLVELLSLKLDGGGNLRSVDPRAVLSYTRQRPSDAFSPAIGREIAHRFEARYFTFGSLVRAGSEVHLEVALYDVLDDTGRPRLRATAQGEPDQILSLLDEVAAQILEEANDGLGLRGEKNSRENDKGRD